MTQTRNHTAWQCPHCQADMTTTGVSEVKEGLNRWTTWRRHNGRWEFVDEDDQDDYDRWYLECRNCAKRLPEPVATVLWAEIEASW